jgi:hypothetical protein
MIFNKINFLNKSNNSCIFSNCNKEAKIPIMFLFGLNKFRNKITLNNHLNINYQTITIQTNRYNTTNLFSLINSILCNKTLLTKIPKLMNNHKLFL